MKKSDIQNVYSLSPMQEGMLFSYQFNKDENLYFEQAIIKIDGKLSLEIFQQAFNLLIRKHDVLRTVFTYQKTQIPRQIVLKNREARVFYRDLSQLDGEECFQTVRQYAEEDRKRGFDIGKDLLIRITLFKTGDNSYQAVWSFHHIIMDGWCFGILVKDFLDLYEQTSRGLSPSISKPTPYSAYISWLQRQDRDTALEYWRSYLADSQGGSSLPRIGSNSDQADYLAREIKIFLDEQVTESLVSIARQSGATLNTLIMTLWGILLGRLSHTGDIVFGYVIAGRPAEIQGIQEMVGLFINTIPVRVRSQDSSIPFNRLLKSVQLDAIQSQTHGFLPLAEIAAESSLGNELFDHIMGFENYPLERDGEFIGDKETGLAISGVEFFERTEFDLTIIVTPGKKTRVHFKYNGHVYRDRMMENVAAALNYLAGQVAAEPGVPLHRLALAPPDKNAALWNAPPEKGSIANHLTSILCQAEIHMTNAPDRIAAVCGPPESEVCFQNAISAGCLWGKSGEVAAYLLSAGLRPGDIVAVSIRRSIDWLAFFIGILRARLVYMPVDVKLPDQRKYYMAKDAAAKIIITEKKESWVKDASRQITLDELFGAGQTEAYQFEPPQWDDPAYLIYTSGSTGNPKGVLIEHGALAHFVDATNASYEGCFSNRDRCLVHTAIGFDVSISELAIPLYFGSCLVVTPDDWSKGADTLSKIIVNSSITYCYIPPALLPGIQMELMSMSRTFALNTLLVGVEPIKDSVLAGYLRLKPSLEILNVYGPTESTIYTIVYRYTHCSETGHRVPIGRAMNHVWIFLADDFQQPVPKGLPGEILITGHLLARGYVNKPEQTAERFLEVEGIGPVYKTGDQAIELADGNIEFIGRFDNQVKIRGHRVELEEIAAAMCRHPHVQIAVVVVIEDNTGDSLLSGYYEAEQDKGPDETEFRNFLSASLPDYMIPTYFTRLDSFPRTPNGKIDRGALPAPAASGDNHFIPPAGPLETGLAGIWSSVLDIPVEHIGIDDDFFSIGGHSLRAMLLSSRIYKEFGVECPVSVVFESPTIRQLARFLGARDGGGAECISPVELKEYYPLSPAQTRLYFLEQLGNTGTTYNMFTAISITGSLDRQRLENACRGLILRHESFRTSFITIDGQPVQRIHRQVEFVIESIDGDWRRFIRPFDLSSAPLLRVGLSPSRNGEYLLLLDMHHIISDGTSMGIITKDLVRLYNGDCLEDLHLQYRDYAAWQSRREASGTIEPQKRYWLERFSGVIPVLELPVDFPRPTTLSFAGDRLIFELDKDLSAQIVNFCQEHDVTLFMNLCAAFNVLLHKYTGQQDIVVGTGVMGRPHADTEEIVGMFVNALALKNTIKGESYYVEYVGHTRSNILEAFENQEAQFEEVVDRLGIQRDSSRNPLFDVMVVVQNFQQPSAEVGQARFAPYEKGERTSKFDMTLFAYQHKETIQFKWEYNIALFKEATIRRMADHLTTILRQCSGSGRDLPIADMDILSDREKHDMLVALNQTESLLPPASTICNLFLEQVETHPHRIALAGGREDIHLSYCCLREKAEELANVLTSHSHRNQGRFAAILLERDIDCLIAIMGILLAGWAYMPIDPSFPQRRVQRMIDDVGTPVLFTQKKFIRLTNRLLWECASLNHVFVIDSFDAAAEQETEQSQLMERGLWEYIGENANDDITGGGWLDSFTGQPFSRREMDEYGDNVLMKLKPLLNKTTRILEIGSASGITMFRVAPLVEFYLGCDLSQTITDRNRRIVEREGITNIQLECLAAHEIDTIAEEHFDIVIINSVIQCFHGHNYLRQVLSKAIAKLKPQGFIFAGDIMDLDLKGQLERDLKTFQQENEKHSDSTKTDWSTELFLSRDFFDDLPHDIPEIQKVTFSKKIHTIENELTRYRYDVLLSVDKRTQAGQPKNSRRKFLWDRRVLNSGQSLPQHSVVHPGDPAYIIFTSGSTGIPKGTLTTHRNVLRVVKQTNYLTIHPEDRILQLSNTAFDGSVFDIFAPLLNGAALVLPTGSKERGVDVLELCNLLKYRHITVFFLTTALFNTLVEIDIDCFAGVRKVLFGGERISLVHTRRALGRLGPRRMIHVYGPTETTVFATYYPIDHISDKAVTVPIGKPISNTAVYVLDRQLKPQPYGVPGELWIGGQGLATGYLNNPDLTGQRFIHWTVSGSVERLYRSGDLVRLLPDQGGVVEFIGRVDRQVKIRGFRIELSEIEHCLVGMSQVREAVVLAMDAPGGEKALEAWIVPTDNFNGDIGEIKEQLAGQVPAFMVPAQITAIPDIPLTTNGKVDRRKLLSLQEPEEPETRVKSLTPTEETLLGIWASLLGIPAQTISIEADFFQLGGHSLKATMLVARVQRKFGVKLPLSDVFRTPTIKQLAEAIDASPQSRGLEIQPTEKRDFYPLSSAQQRMLILQQSIQHYTGYNMPAVFQLTGALKIERVETTFRKLVHRHESLRTRFVTVNETPVQRITDDAGIAIEEFNGTSEEVIRGFIRPFALDEAPLLRVGLLKLERDKHLLLTDMHHIISDGVSMGVLIKEFMEIYRGENPETPWIHYRDYALWETDPRRKRARKRMEDYWVARFKDAPPPLELPLDFPRPLTRNFSGETLTFSLDPQITADLKRICVNADVTMFMMVSSLLRILLAKLCGRSDIVIGTPVSGRGSGPLEKVVGMFVNTLALRGDVLWNLTFEDYLAVVKKRTIDDFQHQDFPFERLVELVGQGRQSGRNPLFDVMFSFQNMDIPRLEIPGLQLEPYSFGVNRSLFDLTFTAAEVDDSLRISIEYSDELFKRETVQTYFQEGFTVLAFDAVKRQGIPIKELEFIAADRSAPIPASDSYARPPSDSSEGQIVLTAFQRKLADIWASVLAIDIESIKPDSDFFLSGGHSLKATRLIARVRKQLKAELSLEEVFHHSTISRMAAHIQTLPGCAPEPVELYEKREHYPLSAAQQRIYSAWKQAPDSTAYNMPVAMTLKGKLDVARLRQCFDTLFKRHDSFRTSYFLQDGELRQRVMDDCRLILEDTDTDLFIRPFDLQTPPLYRVSLKHSSPGEHTLLVDMHHIASDGTSIGILVRELATLYNGGTLKPLQYQYRDYALRQQRFSEDRPQDWQNQKRFWGEVLNGELPHLSLPMDAPKKAGRQFKGGEIKFSLDRQLTQELRNMAAVHGTTMFAVVLALYNVLLARLSNQQDIIVGTAAAGRELDEWQDIVGMFVNTLPLRNFPKDHETFADFLSTVGERCLEAFQHQELQLEEIFGPPPIDAFFVFQNLDLPSLEMGEVTVEFLPLERNTSKFDLLLDATLRDGRLHAGLEYNDRIFKRQTAESFVRYLTAISQAVAQNPGRRLGEIELLTGDEKHELLAMCNGPTLDGEYKRTVIQLFEEQADKQPDCIAVSFGDRNVSYGALHRMSGILACRLTADGAPIAPLTAICLSYIPDAIAAMLAVLKTGSAFLFIPDEYPALRKKGMLSDSGVNRLICRKSMLRNNQWIPNHVQLLEPEFDLSTMETRSLPEPVQVDGHRIPLYAVYTSGSTGTPRGVLVSNGVIDNLIAFQLRFTNIDFDRVLQFASLGFDVAVQEIFTTFAAGGTLHTLDHSQKSDLRFLFDEVGKNSVSTVFWPTAFFKFLVNSPQGRDSFPACVRHIVVAGEQLTLSPEASTFLESNQIYLHNHYGPSETHVVTTWTMAPSDSLESLPPIGKPIANCGVYILNRNGKPQPPGVAGELWVSGDAVGLGYLNQPATTQNRFTKPNDNEAVDSNWYRTGDLARVRADGIFEYLGRIDRQVKIRGFRVEPAEIETALLALDPVEEAVVISLDEGNGQRQLVAYVTSASNRSIDTDHLTRSLQALLPSYMIPSHIVSLPEFPLTANGKLDRRALPEPETPQTSIAEPPANEVEQRILGLWSDVLGIGLESFGVTDNFFSLGGHSLKATMLAVRIQQELETECPMQIIFQRPTVRGQAGYIKKSGHHWLKSYEPLEQQETYPLSPPQQRIFLLHQVVGDRPVYNMPHVFKLNRVPDTVKIEKIFKQLIQRHESLRTSFIQVDGEARQRVHQEVAFQLEKVENTDHWLRPFDLAQAPLLRVGLAQSDITGHLLFIDIHHIVCDGVSLAVLLEEFQALYRGEELETLLLQYKDVALQTHYSNIELWLKRLSPPPAAIELPVDVPQQPFDYFGEVAGVMVEATLTTTLKEIANSYNCTYFMLLISLYSILLSRLSGQEDIIVGTPASGRDHRQKERCVGMFVNTLPLRFKPSGGLTFEEYLAQVRDICLEAFANQNLPFEELVDRLNITRDPNRNPLFDVMFTLNNVAMPTLDSASDLSLEPLNHPTGTAKFHLTLGAIETDDGTAITVEFSNRLFKRQTIARWCEYFKKIAAEISSSLKQPLHQIELLSEEQKRELADTLTGPPNQEVLDRELSLLFIDQCGRTPDAVALQHPETGSHITYRQCLRQTESMAAGLRKRAVGPGHIVALPVEDAQETILAMLAVLMSGAAYLPLNLSLPQDRINFILRDANVSCILGEIRPGFGEYSEKTVSFQELQQSEANGDVLQTIAPKAPAYIIYTSGSTGTPKGVVIPRQAVTRIAKNNGYVSLNQGDRLLQWSNPAFDGSVFDIYGALLNGGALVTISQAIRMSVDRLGPFILKESITVFFITTAMFNALVDECLHDLIHVRHVLFGGERGSLPHVRKGFDFLGKGRLINGYGPTETTVFATYHQVDAIGDLDNTIPIGTGVAETTIYLLDRFRQQVPEGVTGEIWIGGEGLALGYLNRPEATAEVFCQLDLELNNKPTRLYKSGDLGRLTGNGALEFVGRKDRQLKIRGFRIELGEIEHRLQSLREVRDVIVAPLDLGGDGHLTLVAYVVFHPGIHVDLRQMRQRLSSSLPSYMIPSYFIPLEKIPVTANGKVNHALLPSPPTQKTDANNQPHTDLQRELAKLWRELLASESAIGLEDDFFLLGGHSIKASIMLKRVRERYGVSVPLPEFFKQPDILCIEDYILATKESGSPSDRRLVKLTNGSPDQNPIFLIHDGSGDVDGYSQLCDHLAIECLCWGIRASSDDYPQPVNTTITAIANEYLPLLRGVQPVGPYRLAGWSIGGTIAFELALQLQKMGETIEFLGLIDSAPPLPKQKRENEVVLNTTLPAGLTKERVLELIPQEWKSAIPGIDTLSFAELVPYVHIVLSLDHARHSYVPNSTLSSTVHYFAATDSPIKNENGWQPYIKEEIQHYYLEGDHYSIVRNPQVAELARLMTSALNKEMKSK